MIKRILVPLDGSDCSMRALDLAFDMAGRYEAKVVLLYVVPNQPVPKELRRFAKVEHLVEQTVPRHLAERMLDSANDRAQRSGLRDPKRDVRMGSPTEEILAAAKDHGVDLIVMGSRGLGEVKGLLLGSVSHKVSQLSPCPCVTVR